MTIEHKRSSKAEIEDLIKARYSLIWITSAEETARRGVAAQAVCRARDAARGVVDHRGLQDDRERAGHARRQGSDEGDRSRRCAARAARCSCCATSIRSSRSRRSCAGCATRRPSCARRRRACSCCRRSRRFRPSSRRASRRCSTGSCRTARRSSRQRARCCRTCRPATQQVIESDPTFMERVVEGALGLTLVEAENVFAKSAVRTHTFDLETILEEKKQIIRKSGMLEYYEHREEFSDVGGMEILKDWLVKRRSAFTLARARLRPAAAEGHPADRRARHRQVAHREGGRRAVADAAACASTSARSSAASSAAPRRTSATVIKTAEAIAPAILWIDELEKGFSGTGSSGQTDGGTTSRVFAYVHHLAAGEDDAGVRDRDREQRPRSCRPSCCARAASTRSSSAICPTARSAARSSTSTCARRSATRASSTWTSSSTRPSTTRAPSSSRR